MSSAQKSPGQASAKTPEKKAGRIDETQQRDALELAWKIHSLNLDWIGRVDSKAWILVTLVGANLLLVYNLALPGHSLNALDSAQHVLLVLGVVLLSASCVMSVLVVLPSLRIDWKLLYTWGKARRQRKKEASLSSTNSVIYFGDARRKSALELDEILRSVTLENERAMLATQLWTLARINWHKHLLVLISVYLWIGGAVLILLASR